MLKLVIGYNLSTNMDISKIMFTLRCFMRQTTGLSLLISVMLHGMSHAFECTDIPGYDAIPEVENYDDMTMSSTIWILEAPKSNIDFEKTLANLIIKAQFNRQNYYAQCEISKSYDNGFSRNLQCTNRYGLTLTSKDNGFNIWRTYFNLPDKNGLALRTQPDNNAAKSFFLCKLSEQVRFTVGRVEISHSTIPNKIYFASVRRNLGPLKLMKKLPTANDARF